MKSNVLSWKSLFMQKKTFTEGSLKFSNKDLFRIVIPLIIEQFLAVFVGMADMSMISGSGEHAVAGVALVDTVSILFINVFSALATGGAVITGYFIGQKKYKDASKAAEQLIIVVTGVAVVIMVILLLGQNIILYHIFGDLDSATRSYARTYLNVSAISIPFIGLYNSGASLFRATGNTKLPMFTSLLMNTINIALNAVFIYGFGMEVKGAAIATLIARIVSGGLLFALLHDKKRQIHLSNMFKAGIDFSLIKRILYIGIPNGLENSMFQIGKILVLSLVASFGAASIAANGVSNTLASFQTLPGIAIGYAVVTIISQCVGSLDYEQARYYAMKLLKIAYACIWVINIVIFLFLPLFLKMYSFEEGTLRLIRQVTTYHGICACIAWPASFTLPNTFRASGDVKYSMAVSVVSMWFGRIVLSFVLGKYLKMGLMGVWVAMTIDWAIRAVCFIYRYMGEKWQNRKF